VNGVIRGTDLPMTEQSQQFKIEFDRNIAAVLDRIIAIEMSLKALLSIGVVSVVEFDAVKTELSITKKTVADCCTAKCVAVSRVDVDLPLESESFLSTDFITSD
jgi:hypothetical protein